MYKPGGCWANVWHNLCHPQFQENSMHSRLLDFGALGFCHGEGKYHCHKGLNNECALCPRKIPRAREFPKNCNPTLYYWETKAYPIRTPPKGIAKLSKTSWNMSQISVSRPIKIYRPHPNSLQPKHLKAGLSFSMTLMQQGNTHLAQNYYVIDRKSLQFK